MLSLAGFLETLQRSRLLDQSQVDAVRAELKPAERDDLAAVVRALVRSKLLTKFQAGKLLAGKHGPFFLGGYRIQRQLGAGGMAKVYSARQTETGHKVALKVLPPKRAAEERNALARFRREAHVSRRLAHPNIAQALEVGEDGGVHFIVMEYIPGRNVFDMVQRGGPLRVPDAARLFSEIADGLSHVHGLGIIHRDIKPSNVMVTPDGSAKLLDLGLARDTGDDESHLTREGTVVGTVDYIAPEQVAGVQLADERSDIYSLGCTLYYALAGRPPYAGGDLMSKIYRHRMEDPEPLEKVAAGVPPEFAALVRKMMAKDPADRYASAAELCSDLTRWNDPERVRALVGNAAESGQLFRPPPPEIDESEIQVEEGISLRSLGEAEPQEAPLTRVIQAAISRTQPQPGPPTPLQRIRARQAEEPPAESLTGYYIAIAAIIGVGIVAILALAILNQ
jgi:serine/threonine protein kinase